MFEIIRRAARRAFPGKSRVFQLGSDWLNLFSTVRKEGWHTYSVLQSCRTAGGAVCLDSVSVKLRMLDFPFWIRPGTSDALVLMHNLIREEYGRVRPRRDPVWMIDAGAYIGDTAAYFLSRFPRLRVVALEPVAANFQAAAKNLEPYGDRAVLLNKGLWVKEETLRFAGEGLGGRISQGDGPEVACVTIPGLMSRFGMDRIDILKMDIEGAEEQVVGDGAATWLRDIEEFVLEIHSPTILAKIAPVMRESGFQLERYRSIWYARRAGPANARRPALGDGKRSPPRRGPARDRSDVRNAV